MLYFVLNGSDKLGTAVAKAGGFPVESHEERDFEDGQHKARPLVSVRGHDVYVLHVLIGDESSSVNDKLLRLLFFVATLKENGAARVTVLVPYLPYSRKDRQTKPRDPVTTRYVAQLFEAVGTDMVVTVDVHNISAFQNAFRCRTTHLSAAHLFAEDILARQKERRLVFFSPDGGGLKRVQLLKEAWEAMAGQEADIGLMEKRRSGGQVWGEAFAGDVDGADVVMLDDLIVSGGTLVRAAEACRAHGAAKISVYATHGLFSEGAANVLGSAPIDEIVISDSAVTDQDGNASRPECRVVSLASLLAEAVLRLHGGGSIHRLLEPEK